MKQYLHLTLEAFELMTKHLIRAALALLLTAPLAANAQNKAIDFNPKMPFSDGFVAGNTLYVAGQQGPDDSGKVTGTTIDIQTERAINAIQRIVEKAGFKMNEVYKRLMPNPKPARATVKVAGLIGDAKIEISAIAVKQ